jgi:hypothetical protein
LPQNAVKKHNPLIASYLIFLLLPHVTLSLPHHLPMSYKPKNPPLNFLKQTV